MRRGWWWIFVVAFAGATPATRFIESERYPVGASTVAFAPGGAHWIAGVGQDTVVFDGEREIKRFPLAMIGVGERLVPLPDGKIAAGGRLLDADGNLVFQAQTSVEWLGRYAGASDLSYRPDGAQVLVVGENHPGDCYCERGNQDPTPYHAEVILVDLTKPLPNSRVLVDHPRGAHLRVAAGSTWLAASDDDSVLVWSDPATPPRTVKLGKTPARIQLSADGKRLYAFVTDVQETPGPNATFADHAIVIDPTDLTHSTEWSLGGRLDSYAVRPGTAQVALGVTDPRGNKSTLSIREPDGKVVASAEIAGFPTSIGWSPDGQSFLVAWVSDHEYKAWVSRYRLEM